MKLSTIGVALAMPIAIYEMILAGSLIVKGFNPSAIRSEPARTATSAQVLSAA